MEVRNPPPIGGVAMLFWGSGTSTLAAGATRYFHTEGGGLDTLEIYDSRLTMPVRGTMDQIYAWVSAAVGAGETQTFTVRLNGAPTALVVVIGGAVDVDASNLVDSFDFVAGDVITVEIVASAGAAARAPFCTMRLTNLI